MRQSKSGQVTIHRKTLAFFAVSSHAGPSRGSGSGLCWRATRQGIPGRKLIKTMSAGGGRQGRSRLLQRRRCLPARPGPIGLIDLPMPLKTHTADSSCCCRRPRQRFKLRRRTISQRRMQPAFVVNLVDEFADRRACLLQRAITLQPNLLGLQGLHETLRPRVVIGIAATAHRNHRAVGVEQFDVGARSVLHALVGMMHPSRRRPPELERIAQRPHRQLGFKRSFPVASQSRAANRRPTPRRGRRTPRASECR